MHKGIQLKHIGIIVLLIILLAPIVVARATETDSQRVVRVSCGMNKAIYLDDEKKPAGYCLDYLEQLAWINNWKLEYVEGSWNDSVDNLLSGKIDLLMPTQMTEDRKQTMGFPDYICGYQQIALFAKTNSKIYYNDYESFKGKRIAVSEGSSNKVELDNFAKAHGFTYVPVDLNSTQDKFDALADGSVDMIAFSTLNDVPDGKEVAVLNSLPFYICTRIDDTSLLSELNEGMQQLMVDYPDLVTEQFDKALVGENIISLTKGEAAKVEAHTKVVVGLMDDTLPLSGKDTQGNQRGIYVDLLKAIEKKSGLNIEIKMFDRQHPVYDALADGEVDFMVGSSKLPLSREDHSQFLISNTITDYTTVVITKPDYQFEQAEKPSFALTSARRYLEESIQKNYPQSSITYYETAKQCLQAVQSGKADATMMNTWEYNYHTKNPRFQNMMEWESTRIHTDLVLTTTKSEAPDIMSIMEKTISQLSADEVNSIIASNLNMPYESYNLDDRLYVGKNILLGFAIVLCALIICFAVVMMFRQKNEKDLMAKNTELAEANQAKSSFLSRMSHELRTPLNAMMGYTGLLRQNVVSDTMDKDVMLQNLDYSERATNYLLEIIDDILDMQNISNGTLVLKPRPVDADSYLKNVVDMVRKEAKDKGVHFRSRKLTHSHGTYELDAVRLQQILLNLLYNAVKFTPKGGSVRMTSEVVSLEDDLATLRFAISDTGIGMSQEFMENSLYKNFAQENQGTTSPYDGCGTGLAITKQLIDLMDGQIECESTKGEGTTFTVTIKAKQVDGINNTLSQSALDLTGIHVLICEDNPMNQDMERKILEKMGCTVVLADDGAIGVDRFTKSQPNEYSIVLMDIRMPNLDGLEATRAIRALDRPDAKTVPILAVSANAFPKDVEQSLAAGMNEHLAKPVDARILFQKINTYCKNKNTDMTQSTEIKEKTGEE